MKKTLCFIPMAAILFAACSTTQNLGSPNEFKPESTAASLEEEEQLNDNAYRNKIALAITEAVEKYFGNK